MPKGRHVKVMRYRILKPVGAMSWNELGELLRNARYRTFRLANLAVSENYLNFHMFRTGRAQAFKAETIGEMNRRLRDMLKTEGASDAELDRFSKTGALPDTVASAISQYKIRAITNKNKWAEVIRGKSSLPTFRLEMSVPVRCDKPGHRRFEKAENGNVEVGLMVCTKPYPRVVLATGNIGGSATEILKRLLDNPEQKEEGWRQRLFEVKQDSRDKKWWLYVTYDFPAGERPKLNPDVIVGVDVGVSVPLYAAVNNGHARLGRKQFGPLGSRIRQLQNQIDARRRSIQRGGNTFVAGNTARSGHGVTRKIQGTEKVMGKVNNAYTTLNHQLSAAVVKFAQDHGAGTIQMEDLSGLNEVLTGTFIGARWRYHELFQFVEYKAKEAGIGFKKVNPRYTSRRCSKCGHIHAQFDRTHRDANRTTRGVARFKCPACEFQADPDYNAARNLATPDIAAIIKKQCKQQGIATALSQPDQDEAAS